MPDTLHVVECLFAGRIRYLREIELAAATREAVARDLRAGQYDQPVRVIAFNPEEGWCRDVSAEFPEVRDQESEIRNQTITTVSDFRLLISDF
jgi:hypothetical protein